MIRSDPNRAAASGSRRGAYPAGMAVPLDLPAIAGGTPVRGERPVTQVDIKKITIARK